MANSTLRLKVYAPKMETFRNSFFPKTIPDWNKLSEDAASAPNLDTFKNKIDNLFD